MQAGLKKTTQLLGNIHDNGNPFLADFLIIEKSNPSKAIVLV